MIRIGALLLIVYYASNMTQESIFISLAILVLYIGIVSKNGNEAFSPQELDEKEQVGAPYNTSFGPHYSTCAPPDPEDYEPIDGPDAYEASNMGGADFTQSFLDPPILP